MSIIRNFIAKQLFKKGGSIANNKAVDFSTNALIKRLDNLEKKIEKLEKKSTKAKKS